MTPCAEFATWLDDYVDGALSPLDQQRIEAHLAGCPGCRAEVETLRQLLVEARQLPRSVLPERELWAGIAARLTPAVSRHERRRGLPSRAVHRLGLLAAALACILLGAVLATLWQRHAAPTGFAAEQTRYNAAAAALADQLAREPSGLSPATRAVVERNLHIVDAAIREAETALSHDPGNAALEQMLVARYQQRLALLRRATQNERAES